MTPPNKNEIVDVDLDTDSLTVVKISEEGAAVPKYNVIVNGVVKHPNSTAENVMAAMAHYIHSLSYKLSKLKSKGD
jgi:hypothetical protein